MRKERVNEIWGVLFLLLGFFTLASLAFFQPDDIAFYTSHPHNPVENYTGVTGAYLAFGLLLVFGISAYLIPLLFLLWSGCFFLQRVPERKFFKFLGLGLALFSMATIITITVEPAAQFSRGGVIGYLAGSHLLRYFGHVGGYIVAGACFLLSLLLATDFLIYPIIKKFARNVQLLIGGLMEGLSGLREMLDDSMSTWHNRSAKSEKKSSRQEPKPAVPERISTLPEIPLKVKKYEPHIAEATERLKAETLKEQGVTVPAKAQSKAEQPRPVKAAGDKEKTPPSQAEDEKRFEGVIGSSAKEGRYQLPGVDFLKKPVAAANQTDNLQENSKLLERALAEFGMEVKVVEVEQGPVITRYELLPAPGVKVNSIASLSDDLALALKA
ncbi:MAG: DNA translocase FtsK 4TM domain-containing protein, partial [Candidatus Omnitrophica bacterium]|nr:DNA translocase FtsK 4TM domain-containing protein [Candidatus Omnitrophota bacterium]